MSHFHSVAIDISVTANSILWKKLYYIVLTTGWTSITMLIYGENMERTWRIFWKKNARWHLEGPIIFWNENSQNESVQIKMKIIDNNCLSVRYAFNNSFSLFDNFELRNSKKHAWHLEGHFWDPVIFACKKKSENVNFSEISSPGRINYVIVSIH